MTPNDPNTTTAISVIGPTNLLAQAQYNTANAASRLCAAWNSAAIADYHTKDENWFQNWLNHPDMAGPEPTPPMAYEVQYVMDPTSGPGTVGIYGDMPVMWAAPVVGKNPVCAPIPRPYSNIVPSGSPVSQPVTE